MMSVSVESGHYSDKDVEFEGQVTTIDLICRYATSQYNSKTSEDF